MRRLLAAALALLLMFSTALAAQDAPIAYYGLPDGAEAFYLTDAADMAVPEGLEGLYRLMTAASQRGDTYLVRMPHGRALASVSCTAVYEEKTAQEMTELWPAIREGIRSEGAQVDEAATQVDVTNQYDGIDMLRIRTRLSMDGALWLEAEGLAFCRGGEITEVWAVCPENGLYAGDTAEADELIRDRRDLRIFMDSLSFPESWEDMAMGVPYTDRDGRFVMALPEDAVVIDIHSTPEEVEDARSRYIAANPEGAAAAFDEYMQDVTEERTVLVLTGDMQGAMVIFASQEENFRGVTPDQLSMLAGAIRDNLQERFGVAECLANDGRVEISGMEHAHIGYWLRTGELDLMLDILGCVVEDDWLYEADVYASEANQEVRTLLHSYLQQTMIYTPPANGLSE